MHTKNISLHVTQLVVYTFFFFGKACRVFLLDACRISIECICIPSVISKSDEDTFVGYLYNFDTCRILLAKLYVLLIKRKCLCCVGFLWAQITSPRPRRPHPSPTQFPQKKTHPHAPAAATATATATATLLRALSPEELPLVGGTVSRQLGYTFIYEIGSP
jgi:hypothetical protein